MSFFIKKNTNKEVENIRNEYFCEKIEIKEEQKEINNNFTQRY